mmetsp:Transcript_13106/g.29809  ORF Transcript_13106/g.29809 Transcript_13106/m.29809 type:complete len:235 (-) Transcript_13106:71-775(-)
MAADQEVYDKLDLLQADAKYEEVLAECQKVLEKDPADKEVLWRQARGLFDMADNTVDDAAKKEQFIRSGVESAEKLMGIDESYWLAHKWLAILISGLGPYQSMTDKIQDGYKIKVHGEKALELHPNGGDSTTNHLLGRWCSSVASVTWMERKIASTLFGKPPESTHEEALSYYLKADELDASLRNTLCLGDTYYALKKYPEARAAYQRCLDWPDAGTPFAKSLVAEAGAKIKKC